MSIFSNEKYAIVLKKIWSKSQIKFDELAECLQWKSPYTLPVAITSEKNPIVEDICTVQVNERPQTPDLTGDSSDSCDSSQSSDECNSSDDEEDDDDEDGNNTHAIVLPVAQQIDSTEEVHEIGDVHQLGCRSSQEKTFSKKKSQKRESKHKSAPIIDSDESDSDEPENGITSTVETVAETEEKCEFQMFKKKLIRIEIFSD